MSKQPSILRVVVPDYKVSHIVALKPDQQIFTSYLSENVPTLETIRAITGTEISFKEAVAEALSEKYNIVVTPEMLSRSWNLKSSIQARLTPVANADTTISYTEAEVREAYNTAITAGKTEAVIVSSLRAQKVAEALIKLVAPNSFKVDVKPRLLIA